MTSPLHRGTPPNQNDAPSVSAALLARICWSTPPEAAGIAMELTPRDRALLALSCNARAHLRERAQAVAGKCEYEDLVRYGGTAGKVLGDQVLSRMFDFHTNMDVRC